MVTSIQFFPKYSPNIQYHLLTVQSTLEVHHSSCPFCEQIIFPGNLARSHHLGQHMEEIAFLVVTNPYEDWLFYDNTSGGSIRSEPVHDSL